MICTASQFHQSFHYKYHKDSGQQALFNLVSQGQPHGAHKAFVLPTCSKGIKTSLCLASCQLLVKLFVVFMSQYLFKVINPTWKNSEPKKQQFFLVLLPCTLHYIAYHLDVVDYLDSYLCVFLAHCLTHISYSLANFTAASYVSSCFLAIHHPSFQQPNQMLCN